MGMPDPDWSKPWTVAEFDQSRDNCGLGTELLLPKAPCFSVPETVHAYLGQFWGALTRGHVTTIHTGFSGSGCCGRATGD